MKCRKWIAALLAIVLSSSVVVNAANTMTTGGGLSAISSSVIQRKDLVNLKTNYKVNPLGIEQDDIRFGWQMDSNIIGAAQTDYRIVVTKESTMGTVVWDSGTVESTKSVGILYEGEAVESETRYYWTVTVTDENGRKHTSDAAYFETGADWTGIGWITTDGWANGGTECNAPLFRTEQKLGSSAAVKQARLYVTALGDYEAYINGREVMNGDTDVLFAPGNTDYGEYVQYQTYDVTDYLSGDTVVLGAIVGSGWYGAPYYDRLGMENVLGSTEKRERALYAKMTIQFEDGTEQVISTANPEDWETSDNTPVTRDGIRQTWEYFDARIANNVSGWNDVNFTAVPEYDDWRAAQPIAFDPTGKGIDIRANDDGVMHVLEELPLKEAYTYYESEIIPPEESEYNAGEIVRVDTYQDGDTIDLKAGQILVMDFGQTTSAMPYLEAEGPAGAVISMKVGECISDGYTNSTSSGMGGTKHLELPKGTVYLDTEALGGANCGFQMTLSGEGRDVFDANYHFVSYRAFHVTATEDVKIYVAKSKAVSSVGDKTGTIETSSSTLNQFISNAEWSQTSNYCSIITDCPQREYCGWLGDIQIYAESGIFSYDTTATVQHVMDAIHEFYLEEGGYARIIPRNTFTDTLYLVAWTDCAIILPYAYYLQTGDSSLLSEYWDDMYALMTEIAPSYYTVSEDGTISIKGGQHGDWLGLEGCNNDMFCGIFQIYDSQIMIEMGEEIGVDLAQIETLKQINTTFRDAIGKKYLDDEGNLLNSRGDIENSQTALAWSSMLKLWKTDAQRQGIQANYKASIENTDQSWSALRGENTLACGFGGVNVLLPGLSELGLPSTAYDLMNSTNMYSFLYPVTKGATSVWERWNLYDEEKGWTVGSTSQNHFAYGAATEWLYEYAAGIQKDTENPGFKHIILQPETDPSLSYLNGSYQSYYGEIVSNWTADNGNLTSYEAVVPANTTATLYLPVSADVVNDFVSVDGVTLVAANREHNGLTCAQFELESGGYNFTVADGKLSVSIAQGYVSVRPEQSDADKTILHQVIAYAQTQKDDTSFAHVIESVQASFIAALDNAKEVALDTAADQNTVDKAWIDLMKEIHKLGFVQGDKTSLATLIQTGEIYEASIDNYVDAGKAEFLSALNEARNTYADGDAMESDVKAASEELLNRMMELRLKADKNLLLQAIAAADEIDTATYTEETVMAFNAAKSEAKGIYENENATQEEVNAATDKLTEAINGLVLKSLENTETATVAGDQTLTTKKGNAKTGDPITPIAMAATLLVLAGAGFACSKKRK